MRAETKLDVDYITNVMTGSDGGVAYVKFSVLLEDLDAQAENGDAASIELIAIVKRFARLIQIAQKDTKKR